MMISFCSVESPVVNISKSSTNKSFQTLEDSLDLESSFDYLHKLFTPPFIILRPDSILHVRIVLEQPKVFDHMIHLVQNSCQRTITKLVHLILPQHLLLIISISVDHSPRLISWQCKKQIVVATSSTEAEYVAGASCCAQVLWIQNQMLDYGKSDASEGFNQITDFLNGSYIKYALTVNPTIYVSHIKQIWNTVAIKQSNDVTRLQALVDKKKVVVTEAVIRDTLHLDDAEGVDCLPNEEIFTALDRMGYEKPSTKLTFYKAFFSSQWKFLIHIILQSMSDKHTSWNEFSSAMASTVICLSTGRKFNFSKYIFDSLVRNVDSSSKFYMYPRFIHLIIQNQLGDLSTHTTKYISPALTQKVFANMRRMGKGCSGVETPLFEGMLVARESEEQGDAEEQSDDDNATEKPVTAVSEDDEALDTCAAHTRRVKHLEHDKVAQNLESTKLKTRVKKLKRANKVKTLKLRRLRKVGTSQRVDTSDDTVMEDMSNQGRMIDELDKDEGVVLMNEKEETKGVKDITGDAQVEGRQAEIYQIDIDHAAKVLINAGDVVPTVTTDVVPIVTTAPVKVAVPSTRRRRGVVIRDPKEESSTKTPTETKSKDKGKGIMVEEPKPIKKKQQVELMKRMQESCKKNLIRISTGKLQWTMLNKRPKKTHMCRAKFNYNIEFLLKSKEQMEKEENRAIASINETPAQKAAKRRRLNEEAEDATPLARKIPVVDYQIVHFNNKPHYKIIRADGTHQLYVSFITLLKNFDREDLESLWSIVKERFSTSKPNNFSNDFLLTTLRAMFGRPDGQDQVWMSQRSVHADYACRKKISTLEVYIGSDAEYSTVKSERAE
nr:hypothetical protein [Tanacetum cinerariifolium]